MPSVSGERRPAARGDGLAVPVAMVLGGTLSVQLGASIATTLFDRAGPAGTVLLRVAISALLLWAIWRPRVRGHSRGALRVAVAYGITFAGMNLCFYEALDRIPQAIAVTLEFVGPLGIAIAGSRRRRDLAWVALAAAGLVLLAPEIGGSIDPFGAILALVAGGFWAAYILLAARAGREFPGGTGLALAMAIATLPLIPLGIAGGGSQLVTGTVLAAGLGIAVLSSAIPYSLELMALRHLRTGTFGVLMSLEPAAAAAVAFAVLGQGLEGTEIAGIALVIAASAGALSAGRAPAAPEG